MRNCFFIILSLFIIACNKPKKVIEETYPDNSPKVEKYYIEKESSKELVKEIRYYPNNKIQMEGKYKNNKRNGDWIYYFENGTIWCEGSFLDGVDHGQRIVYYENGQKRYEGSYIKGKQTGIWKFWDEDGDVQKEIDFNQTDSISTDNL